MIQRRRVHVTRLFQEFISSEQSSGYLLMASALLAIILMNSVIGHQFQSALETKWGWEGWGIHLRLDVRHWINEGLMAIFFLLIGLEIERELYKGELSDPRNALLPLLAALGGMLIPALIHYSLNHELATYKGFGIPMATDIAFALGVLTLLGKRVPPSLKIFLTALAIIDDVGAMIVIAIFYSTGLKYIYLLLALIVFISLGLFNRYKFKSLWIYLPLGVLMWYFMLESGVHATLAGVMLAFNLPFEDGGPQSTSTKVEHALNKPVAWLIMPIFALANAGIAFSTDFLSQAFNPNTIGIFLGLYIGKPLGILSFSYLGILLKWVKLPEAMGFKHMLGGGFLGGIGFTMSMFITILAFGNSGISDASKFSIIIASLLAGLTGYLILQYRRPLRQHLKYKHKHRDSEAPAEVNIATSGGWAPVVELNTVNPRIMAIENPELAEELTKIEITAPTKTVEPEILAVENQAVVEFKKETRNSQISAELEVPIGDDDARQHTNEDDETKWQTE